MRIANKQPKLSPTVMSSSSVLQPLARQNAYAVLSTKYLGLSDSHINKFGLHTCNIAGMAVAGNQPGTLPVRETSHESTLP